MGDKTRLEALGSCSSLTNQAKETPVLWLKSMGAVRG